MVPGRQGSGGRAFEEPLVMSARIAFLCLSAGLMVSGCGLFNSDRFGGNDPDAQRRAEDPYHTDPKYMASTYNPNSQGKDSSILSMIFSDNNNNGGNGGGGPGIGVNSFLWHASLDTVSFMPLASADPFGGTIITEWYSPPETPNERFKINLFIMSRDLRADGVRARVFRQNKDASGQWVDAAVDQTTGTGIENAILARARQIRMSTVAK